MKQALERCTLYFANRRIQTLAFRNELRRGKWLRKLHGEIDFASRCPAFETAPANNRVVTNDLQIRPQDWGIREGMNEIEDEVTAVALREGVPVNASMVGRTEFGPYVVIAQHHRVITGDGNLFLVAEPGAISFARILPCARDKLR